MVTEDSTVTATIDDVTGKQIRMIELGHMGIMWNRVRLSIGMVGLKRVN